MRHFIVFGILLGLCFIAYSNGLHNAFMWDDGPAFSDIKIKNIKFLPNAFFYPTAHSNKLDSFDNSDGYYRPMAYVITLLSYLVFGDNPFGYHVLNLFLFALMSFTVYIFVDLFFKNRALAFATGLLFAVHPINVFFVDYVTSPIHSLRFICMFVSLIFFLKALEGVHKYISYLISFICFIVALLCHETSIVLPFYTIFAAFYFKKMDLKNAALKSRPYWVILSLYLLFRFLCTGLRSALPVTHVNPIIYLATFSKIIFLYVSKLFCPQGIVFFWNSPWMTGLHAFIWIAGAFVVLSGWWLLAKKVATGTAFFCVTWLLIGFIPVFWAAFPPYDKTYYGLIIEPQWVTFASVGFFLYLAFIGLKIDSRRTAVSVGQYDVRGNDKMGNKGMVLLFIFLLIILISITRRCNEIWGDEYKYYFYWSQQIEPLPPINDAYLANIYAIKKEYSQARYYYSKALEKKPNATVYSNLGLIDMRLGVVDEAQKNFLLSVKNDPTFFSAYNNLGVIYFNQRNYTLAKKAFLQTIKLNKYCIEARSNLGLISLLQADYRGAIDYYQENLNIVPYEESSLLGLVQAYTGLKDFDNMDKYSKMLITHGKDPDILAALRKFLAAHNEKKI